MFLSSFLCQPPAFHYAPQAEAFFCVFSFGILCIFTVLVLSVLVLMFFVPV